MAEPRPMALGVRLLSCIIAIFSGVVFCGWLVANFKLTLVPSVLLGGALLVCAALTWRQRAAPLLPKVSNGPLLLALVTAAGLIIRISAAAFIQPEFHSDALSFWR